MAINDYHGQTFVAFIDISGFKELMRKDSDALEALRQFYQAGYDVLRNQNGVEGLFVSDSGILFVRTGTNQEKLKNILSAIKSINSKMLRHNYMLTTSIAFGTFDYHGKLEFEGIEKNPIYGNAYVKAFLDNEKTLPKIQPGQCRLVLDNLPDEINLQHSDFQLLRERGASHRHLYFYWNVQTHQDIESFEEKYNDSYKLKFAGMLQALKQNNNQ